MSYRVEVLGRPEVAAGFALAGLAPVDVMDAPDAARRLNQLLTDEKVGVVLAQQRIYDELGDETRRRLGRRPLPMVVPFPDPSWEEPRSGAAEAYIIELLRQVVGYRVRLR